MIWCVEDDGSIRDIELYALNSAGFETKGFEDGTSFWNALKNEKPELVVLDVMLVAIFVLLVHVKNVYSITMHSTLHKKLQKLLLKKVYITLLELGTLLEDVQTVVNVHAFVQKTFHYI